MVCGRYLLVFIYFCCKNSIFQIHEVWFFFFCKEKGLRALQLFPLVCTWPLFSRENWYCFTTKSLCIGNTVSLKDCGFIVNYDKCFLKDAKKIENETKILGVKIIGLYFKNETSSTIRTILI